MKTAIVVNAQIHYKLGRGDIDYQGFEYSSFLTNDTMYTVTTLGTVKHLYFCDINGGDKIAKL